MPPTWNGLGTSWKTGFCRAWCGRDWQAIRAALCLVLLQTGAFKDMYEMPRFSCVSSCRWRQVRVPSGWRHTHTAAGGMRFRTNQVVGNAARTAVEDEDGMEAHVQESGLGAHSGPLPIAGDWEHVAQPNPVGK